MKLKMYTAMSYYLKSEAVRRQEKMPRKKPECKFLSFAEIENIFKANTLWSLRDIISNDLQSSEIWLFKLRATQKRKGGSSKVNHPQLKSSLWN